MAAGCRLTRAAVVFDLRSGRNSLGNAGASVCHRLGRVRMLLRILDLRRPRPLPMDRLWVILHRRHRVRHHDRRSAGRNRRHRRHGVCRNRHRHRRRRSTWSTWSSPQGRWSRPAPRPAPDSPTPKATSGSPGSGTTSREPHRPSPRNRSTQPRREPPRLPYPTGNTNSPDDRPTKPPCPATAHQSPERATHHLRALDRANYHHYYCYYRPYHKCAVTTARSRSGVRSDAMRPWS